MAWTLIFSNHLGSLSTLSIDTSGLVRSDFGAAIEANVTALAVGAVPAMDSALHGSISVSAAHLLPPPPGSSGSVAVATITVTGLVKGASYAVRVSAWNGVAQSYGAPRQALPALTTVATATLPPAAVVAAAASDHILQVSWQPPVDDGGSFVLKYKVEWDAAPGLSEQQAVTVTGAVSGTFRLSFLGQTTAVLPCNASAARLAAALEALSTVGRVATTRTEVPEGLSWRVTFLDNAGDLPLLTASAVGLRGTGAQAIAVTEVIAGTSPPFDQGTVDIAVAPLGAAEVLPAPPVQTVTVAAAAPDISGWFFLSFGEAMTERVLFDASADELKRALEGVPAVGVVSVTLDASSANVSHPLLPTALGTSTFGRRWSVTFLSWHSAAPMLLVSTALDAVNGAANSAAAIATAGTLAGTDARVSVDRVAAGGLPLNFATPPNLVAGRLYYTRVSAYTAAGGWSAPLRAAVAVAPAAKAPAAPQDVAVAVVSSTELAVAWRAPAVDGGAAVTGYIVQWSADSSFGAGSGDAPISAAAAAAAVMNGTGWMGHFISGVQEGQTVFVRVVAQNAVGFSEPAEALPADFSGVQVQRVMVTANTTSCAASLLAGGGNFSLVVTHPTFGLTEETSSLAFDATAAEMAAALSVLPNVGTVRVLRHDHSSYLDYDPTARGTEALAFEYVVVYAGLPALLGTGSTEAVMTEANVTDTDAACVAIDIAEVLAPADADVGTPGVVAAAVTPSPPAELAVTVVSTTELGVTWTTPARSGGKSVLKYLVAWDKAYTFERAIVGFSNVTLESAQGFSAVVTGELQYKITGLEVGTPYYVRVAAYNGPGGSFRNASGNGSYAAAWSYLSTYGAAAATTPATAVPAAQVASEPTEVAVQLSTAAFTSPEAPGEIPDRLDVSWSRPVVDAATGLFETNDGGATVESYLIEWSSKADFDVGSGGGFAWRALHNNGTAKSCAVSNCSFALGAEVQILDVYSGDGNVLAAGEYQLLWKPADDNGAASNRSSCISFNVSYDDLATELTALVNATVTVSREEITLPGPGNRYWITFLGAGARGDVPQLIPLDDPSGCEAWEVRTSLNATVATTRQQVAVATATDGGVLSPGTPYYVRVSAVNAAGIGRAQDAATAADCLPDGVEAGGAVEAAGACVPRAPPGPAAAAFVRADPASARALVVTWQPVTDDHGNVVSSYTIEVAEAADGEVSWSSYDGVTAAVADISRVGASYERRIVVNGSYDCGQAYAVRVRATNDRGNAPPEWYSGLGLSGTAAAVPTCPLTSLGCVEDNDTSIIVPRRALKAPVLDVPLSKGFLAPNSFTSESLLATFAANDADRNSSGNGTCEDTRVQLWRIEWDTRATFDSRGSGVPLSYNETAGDSPLVWDDDLDETGSYNITGLTAGVRYYIRTSSFGSLGFGLSSTPRSAVPMASSDPPAVPVSLSQLEEGGGYSTAFRGSSLKVRWAPPEVDAARTDRFGCGGSAVTDYLIEWSALPFSDYNQSVQQVTLFCADSTAPKGSFRLALNTTAAGDTLPVHGDYVGVTVAADADVWQLLTALENMPNIGTVNVANALSANAANVSWIVTFTSEAGDVPALTLYDLPYCGGNASAAAHAVVDVLQQGAVPDGAAYGAAVVDADAMGDAGMFEHVVTDLVPGTVYYVRISARNALGYGGRRLAEPYGAGATSGGGMRVPYQTPDAPISWFYDAGTPVLALDGHDSLRVTLGAPLYDGGGRITAFQLEWDPSLAFDSGGGGGPAGSAAVSATATLCDACVDSFTLSSRTLNVNGTDFFGRLNAGNRVLVGGQYVFTVDDVLLNGDVISVSPRGHNALGDVVGPLALELYGGEYTIPNLQAGVPYYVRAFASNQEMGWGAPALATPLAEIPRSAPAPPAFVDLVLAGPHALKAVWAPAAVAGDTVRSYLVEVFTASPVALTSGGGGGSVFGHAEVQAVAVTAPSGTFTLAFGGVDQPLPGTAAAVHGRAYLITSADLTPFVRRGDVIRVGDDNYAVHAYLPFNATHLYLAQDTAAASHGLTAAAAAVHRTAVTPAVPYDAAADRVEELLETLPSVGQVTVSREPVDGGYVWSVTFDTPTVVAGAVVAGDQPPLVVNGRLLGNGTSTTYTSVEVTETRKGVAPDNYQSFVIDAATTAPSFLIPNLNTGVDYYVRVSASSNVGYGAAISAAPLAPKGVPGLLGVVALGGDGPRSLSVEFDGVADGNGADVEGFVVQWGTDPAFGVAATAELELPADYSVQAMRTDVWQRGWQDDSTFSLSLFDFRGAFSRRLGGPDDDGLYSFVGISENSTVLNRTASNATLGMGSGGLADSVARGGFVLVAGQEFSICLDTATAYGDDALALCLSDDPRTPAAFVGASTPYDDTQTQIPAYVLDTAAGAAVDLAAGDTWLTPVLYNDSLNNLTAVGSVGAGVAGGLRRGDYLRLGHPTTGRVFRV
ncbi:unnamed protein product, partial [Phaeothamnion confervicola]